MSASLPVVAIVGRPNVGKSTLFNRIVGRREAIVEEEPGVTRDRKSSVAEWRGRPFTLVDTGGWLPKGRGPDPGRADGGPDLAARVSEQAELAATQADLVLVVTDVVVGVTDEDARVADLLVRRDVPTLLVVNKVDDESRAASIWEFVSLGLGDPLPVSAAHGRGTGDLLDAVVERLPPPTAPASGDEDGTVGELDEDLAGSDDGEDDELLSVAIVGRPNVGKSTLFNRLIGEDRAVVHDLPGTTRDTIDTVVETDGGPVRFVDTAGMRRRARVDDGTEYYSVLRALRAVDAADIALVVVDATEGVTHQDQRLAERVAAAGSPAVVLLSKWDAVEADQRDEVRAGVGDRLAFLPDAPVLEVSGRTGKGLHDVVPALDQVAEGYHRRVPTREVNQVIRAAQAAHAAPGGARVLYATQGASDPPTFTLFANRTLPRTYLRYLERRLREAFDLGSTPLKLRVRRRTS